jgi:transposase
VLYGLRSERLLMEQLDYNLLFRWFVGLSPDDRVWDATSFTKNRERLQQGKVFDKFMVRLLEQPEVKPLLSDEHFSVDGTLIEAWASQELQAEGWRQGRRRLQLSWPETQERHPCLDQRSRRSIARRPAARPG